MGAQAGHDLTIEVTRWRGNVVVDAANPASSPVTVEVDVDSFDVRQGTGGVKPLTDADRADIKNTLRGKILNTGKHPTIAFGSRQVTGTAESFRIDGDLTIIGVTQPVTVDGQLVGGRAHASAVIVQSRWGIRPYSPSSERSGCATRSRSSSTLSSQRALTPRLSVCSRCLGRCGAAGLWVCRSVWLVQLPAHRPGALRRRRPVGRDHLVKRAA